MRVSIIFITFSLVFTAVSASAVDTSYAVQNMERLIGQVRGNSSSFISDSAEIMNDDVVKSLTSEQYPVVTFYDDEINRIADTLSRGDSRYVALVGQMGTDRDGVIQELIRRSMFDQIAGVRHAALLKDLIVLKVSVAALNMKRISLATLLNDVKVLRSKKNLNVVVYLSDLEYLDKTQKYLLRERQEGPNHVPIIFKTDPKELSTTLNDAGFKSILAVVPMKELAPAQILATIKARGIQQYSKYYHVTLNDDVIKAAIEAAKEIDNGLAEPARTQYLLQDFAIEYSRLKPNTIPEKVDVYRFVARKLGLAAIPQDEEAFMKYIEDLRKGLHEDVVGHDEIVDGLVDQFQAAMESHEKNYFTAMFMGSTGQGKSYLAERFAVRAFGSKSRYLRVDMTQFRDEHQMNVLFGAANGYVSAAEQKGIVCEFLDQLAGRGGVIQLDELEKAHSNIVTRFMELFDTGQIRCGDGQVRYLGPSAVIMTSNKNSDRIISPEIAAKLTKDELNRRKARLTEEGLKKQFIEKTSYAQDDAHVVTRPVVERVGAWYYFWPLLKDQAEQVADQVVRRFVDGYEKRHTRKLQVDDSVAKLIVDATYNQENGSRQLERAIRTLHRGIQAFKKQYGVKAQKLDISAKLHPSKLTETFITVRDPETGQEVTVNGPSVRVVNPLDDTIFRQRLVELDTNLNKEIFDQPEAIATLVKVIKSLYLRPDNERLASVYLLGTTGTGKTQLAKMVAQYLYGDTDAVAKFEMDKVNDMHKLDDIFSPAKGTIGSTEPGELERFLLKYPDGGVLLFDEVGSAGGGNLALKSAIFDRFKNFLQGGFYETPSGKKYDLRKYFVMFTSNDGEDFFRGADSENMIRSIYEGLQKRPNLVVDMLRQKGFSDAFLGRLSAISVMRPTKGAARLTITEKMLNVWRDSVMKHNPVDIEFGEGFVPAISRLMFSYKAGARSIEQFIDKVLGGEVANHMLAQNRENLLETGTRAKILIESKTIEPSNPYYSDEDPDEKRAILIVSTIEDGKVVNKSEFDFTEFAKFMPQVHLQTAKFVAYHEMGHAIVSFPKLTGKVVKRISIIPQEFFGGMALGVTEYDTQSVKGMYGRERLVAEVAGLLAGSESERLAGAPETNTGRSNDIERAGALIREKILEHHMLPELDDAHAYLKKGDSSLENMPSSQRELLNQKINEIIAEARQLAQKTLRDNWAIVEQGAQILLRQHELNGEEFNKLLGINAAQGKGEQVEPPKTCEQLLLL